jgi:hypothetical protein
MNPNFADESKWVSIYDQLTIATVLSSTPKTYVPILPILIAGSFSYKYLRVAANNQNAKASWRYGGSLEFLVDNNAGVEIARKSMACNKAIIVTAPDFVDSYKLEASFPFWFDEISLQIEGYQE